MGDRISRRFFVTGLGAALAPAVALGGAPETSLYPQVRPKPLNDPERVVRAAGLQGDVVFAVADVGSGELLESVGAEHGLPPASVAKALTALYALDVLGPEHRFVTRLIADGPIEDGVLNGDLILAGGCDPLLDTEALAVMAADLRKTGLREVRGKFKVYEGELPYVPSIDPSQPDHVGYSPAVTGISLNFNRVHFEWKRGGAGSTVTMDARGANYVPRVAMADMEVVSRKLPIYTYERGPRVDHWTVARGALGQGGARWLPVRKPALYAGDVFQTLARANGIVLSKPLVIRGTPQGTVLVTHESAPLRDILRGMLKYSTNITAEMVGMAATRARGVRPDGLAASAAEMNRWAAETYGVHRVAMVDHSGLGDASRIAPEDLVTILVEAGKSDALRPLLKHYALRNGKGQKTKNHPIRVDAKTGTLNFVSGLGGFITTPEGGELAFAIFTADLDRRSSLTKAQRERPEGARPWNRRSRNLQQNLIERWGALYGK